VVSPSGETNRNKSGKKRKQAEICPNGDVVEGQSINKGGEGPLILRGKVNMLSGLRVPRGFERERKKERLEASCENQPLHDG